MTHILIVEDDYLQAKWMREQLLRAFRDVSIQLIDSEREFHSVFPTIAATPPDVVILDVMLPWTRLDDVFKNPAVELPDPALDSRSAGIRCLTLLQADPRTRYVPVIVNSVLHRMDLPEIPAGVVYTPKDSSADNLVLAIRSILSAAQKLPRRPLVMASRDSTWSASKAKRNCRDLVFISYSHKDKKFLEELLLHLKPLVRARQLCAWSDKQISPGAVWFDDIKNALMSSRVAVLLVTKDFLASDFIDEHELGPLLSGAEKSGVRIIWIPVRACSYRESVLKNYQAVIPPDKPLAEMKAERDRAWVRVCEEIRD